MFFKKSAKKPIFLNPRTSRFREALTRIAQKFDDFETFADYYWNGLARSTYWIGTNNKNFIITDLEKQFAKEGRLVAYVHPEMIKDEFAAEIDISGMNPLYDVTENPKDLHNSIKIVRPDLIKVRYITPVMKAIRIWEYNSRHLPSTKYELLKFWNAAQEKKKTEKPKTRRRKKIRDKTPGRYDLIKP